MDRSQLSISSEYCGKITAVDTFGPIEDGTPSGISDLE
jgi:hypothetical protein